MGSFLTGLRLFLFPVVPLILVRISFLTGLPRFVFRVRLLRSVGVRRVLLLGLGVALPGLVPLVSRRGLRVARCAALPVVFAALPVRRGTTTVGVALLRG